MRTRGLAIAVALGLSLIWGCSDDDDPVTPDKGTTKTDGGADMATAPEAGAEAGTDGTSTPDVAPADAGPPKNPASFVTYNAGLTAAVALAAERRDLIVAELKKLTAEVVCLQEVWSDADAKAVMDGLKGTYPFAFREKTTDTSQPGVKCQDGVSVLGLQTCVDTKCKPKGISTIDCVSQATLCKTAYDKLDDTCKRCLAANVANPIGCVAGSAKDFTDEGRNGLVLLSRVPLTGTKYTAMDTLLVKRGVITATAKDVTLQCTHLPADLGVVPYPTGKAFKSWKEEHAGALDALVKTAPASGCAVLMGDLNTGPTQGALKGELEDNWKKLPAAGYTEPWTSPKCTWCKGNPLTGSPDDRWIDHVMFKGCGAVYASHTYTRLFDQEITIKSGGKDIKTRLSDHYGVRVTAK